MLQLYGMILVHNNNHSIPNLLTVKPRKLKFWAWLLCFYAGQIFYIYTHLNGWKLLFTRLGKITDYTPGSKSPGPQSQKYGTYQLAKRSRIHWVKFIILAVTNVVIVQCATRQTNTFCSLIIVQQPLDLYSRQKQSLAKLV